MKNFSAFAFLLLVITAISCKQESGYGEPVVRPEAITKSLMNFLVYRQKYLRLAEDFTAFDSAEKSLDRATFLQRLSTGRYLPVRLQANDSTAGYQLYNLPDTAKDIRTTLAQWGEQLYSYYKMEGKELPGLHWVDTNGNAYNKENSKGKIMVLKCWFLHCVPCVKEMPALNRLVKEYAARADVTFVSFVPDKKASVDSFLKKTKFDYAVVPDKRAYVWDTLGITSFPTHILVNKQGMISKVVDTEKELTVALKKEAAK